MFLHGVAKRLRLWALALSLLALGSALLAPASVLAQEMSTGKWTGLCNAGLSGQADQPGHAGDDGHCEACVLPVLALPLAAPAWPLAWGPDAASPARALAPPLQARGTLPDIRGPPLL